MKSHRNYKIGEQQKLHRLEKARILAISGAIGLVGLLFVVQSDKATNPIHTSAEKTVSTTKKLSSKDYQVTNLQPATTKPNVQNSQLVFPHLQIITTVFWVGEAADKANGFIANKASAWDEDWATHYGGIDTPDKRNGYYPTGFKPKENPFYFALPFNDFDAQDKRRVDANKCINHDAPGLENFSWCKGTWLAIRHKDKIAYAQWQDVGPYLENDSSYVFGSEAPKNTKGARAGLDVSPAVRDYLNLSDVDSTDWTFIQENQVPEGPWKQITASSKGTHYGN